MKFFKTNLIKILAIINVIFLMIYGMLCAVIFVQNFKIINTLFFLLPILIGIISIIFKLITISKKNLIINLLLDLGILITTYNPTNFNSISGFLNSFLHLNSHIVLLFTIPLWYYYILNLRLNRNLND